MNTTIAKEEDSNNLVVWKIYLREHLILWIKSEAMERIFQRLSAGATEHPLGRVSAQNVLEHVAMNPNLKYLETAACYKVAPFGRPSDRWSWDVMTRSIVARGFNVKALSLVGIGRGLEFPIDYPMSRSMIRELGNTINLCCKELEMDYGRVPNIVGSARVSVTPPISEAHVVR